MFTYGFPYLRKLKRYKYQIFSFVALLCVVNGFSLFSAQESVSYVMNEWKEAMDEKVFLHNRPYVSSQTQIQDNSNPLHDWTKLEELLEQRTTFCHRLVTIGGTTSCQKCDKCLKDGHKFVCLDPDVRPRPSQCLVLSFGIGTDWTFDRGMAVFNCTVLSFDMTNITNSVIGKNLHSLNIGLSHTDEEVAFTFLRLETNEKYFVDSSMRKFSTILDILDRKESQIDFLKLDIEFGEWAFFEFLLNNTQYLNKINQIAVEIHLDDFKNITLSERLVGGRRYEKVLMKLKENNFHLANTELNSFAQFFSDVEGVVFPVFRESLYLRRS